MGADLAVTDAVQAIADLCGRSGARNMEIGFDDDVEPATWWAGVTYNGAKLHTDGWVHPVLAADALAAKILTGGCCTHCGRTVSLLGLEGCVWRRVGPQWRRGCEAAR